MKILFFCHFWPPYHFAGSEVMGQNIFRHLRAAGHETLVIATHEFDAPEEWEFEGTRCQRVRKGTTAFELTRRFAPDVIMTHHGETAPAVNYANYLNVPLVQIVHNNMTYTDVNLGYGADFLIYNTEYLKSYYSKFGIDGCVVHPPVYVEQHATTPGDRVTLVNLNADKGSRIFYELSDRMPDVNFLGVEGGHGGQVFEARPNVVFQRQTTNMKDDVWSKTRILLMPSIYESYGMVGVEAMASGIPVIATPTFGLKESLGMAGTFVSRDDIDAWEREIRALLSSHGSWLNKSSVALSRSAQLDPNVELTHMTEQLERMVSTWHTLPRKTSKHVSVVS